MNKPSGPSKTEVGKILSCIARYIFLTAFAYILLYPLLFIIANSLKGPADYFDPTVEWVPKLVSFSNYSIAAGVMKFGKSLKNTLVIMIVSSVIEIFSCAFSINPAGMIRAYPRRCGSSQQRTGICVL